MRRNNRLATKAKEAKWDKKSIFILFFFVLAVLGLIAYQVYVNTAPSTWVSLDEQLPNNKVCMVNDSYMGVDQIEVPIRDKIYYGCCKMCVNKLNTHDSLRFGIDPFTAKKVDKAKAFIVLKSKLTGAVLYFQSEETFQQYRKVNKD